MIAAASATGWQAQLTLAFQRRNTRTILGHCSHQGPLQVQRPFYPEGDDVCHIAVLHPPGGVVGGDELRIDAALDTGAQALITTPAAGKFYRSAGPCAGQSQHLRVAAGATLEWLPQENIVYNGARVRALTRVELQGNARFLGWEIFCLGRPAAGETFSAGEYRQHFELWREGEPLYLEQGRYAGGDAVLDAPWGLRGQAVSATLLCNGAAPDGVNAIRARWEELKASPPPTPLSERGESPIFPSLAKEGWREAPGGFGPSGGPLSPWRRENERELATVTQLDSVLIGRYLGPSAARARQFFILAWGLLRPALLNRPPCPSRFWNT